MAAPIGLVASGMFAERGRNRELGQRDRQIGLQERRLGLEEQQMQADSQAKQRAAVQKNVGDLLALVDQTAQAVIQRAEDQGLDREAVLGQVEQQVAPLVQRAALLAQASGDPTLALQVQATMTRLRAYRSRSDVVGQEAAQAAAIAAAQEGARLPASAQGASERYYALAARALEIGDQAEADRLTQLGDAARSRDMSRQSAGSTRISVVPPTYGIGPSGERVLMDPGGPAPGNALPGGSGPTARALPAGPGGADPKFFSQNEKNAQARLASIDEAQRNLFQVNRLINARPDLFGAAGKLSTLKQNITGAIGSLGDFAATGGEAGAAVRDLMASAGITDPEMGAAQLDATLQRTMQSYEDYQAARKEMGLEGSVGTVEVLENLLVFNVARALQQEGDRLLAASIQQAKELVNLQGMLEAPETVEQKTNALFTQLESLKESVRGTLQTNVGLTPSPREAPRMTPGQPDGGTQSSNLGADIFALKTSKDAETYINSLGATTQERSDALRSLSREEVAHLRRLMQEAK